MVELVEAAEVFRVLVFFGVLVEDVDALLRLLGVADLVGVVLRPLHRLGLRCRAVLVFEVVEVEVVVWSVFVTGR
jgi:hypothetical protein